MIALLNFTSDGQFIKAQDKLRHQAPPFCWPIKELLKLALAIIELERAIGSPVTSSKR